MNEQIRLMHEWYTKRRFTDKYGSDDIRINYRPDDIKDNRLKQVSRTLPTLDWYHSLLDQAIDLGQANLSRTLTLSMTPVKMVTCAWIANL